MLIHGKARTLALLVVGLLIAAAAAAQQMGGNMGGGTAGGGAGGAGGVQGYITSPPPPQPVTGMRQQAVGSSDRQVEQPDKCKTCENCLTEQCRTTCWRRYCRR